MLEEIYNLSQARGIPAECIIYILLNAAGKELPISSTTKMEMSRHGLMVDSEITDKGYDIIASAHTKINPSKFNEFWKLYPYTDQHSYWTKTKLIRGDKDLCHKWYEISLYSISEDELIEATKRYINDLKSTPNKNGLMEALPAWKYLMNGIYKNYLDDTAYIQGDSEDGTTDVEPSDSRYFVRFEATDFVRGTSLGEDYDNSWDVLDGQIDLPRTAS